MDATPSYSDNKEKKLIHDGLKKVCLQNKKNYKKYQKWCDEYFYLPHRKSQEELEEYFLIMSKKIGLKIFSL
jgi:coproporphyrinogen III oxidase